MHNIELLSTTATLQDRDIQKYLGVVTHQIVIGANIFRDIFSSFRDIVGGSARGYQKDLEKFSTIGLRALQEKAHALGANSIIGLRIDFDDVSGGGKSMFMVSLSGTAVKVENLDVSNRTDQSFQVTFEELDYVVNRKRIQELIDNDKMTSITDEDIEAFINYDIDAGDKVLAIFLEPRKNSIMKLGVEYFKNQPHDAINDFLTSKDFKELDNSLFKRIPGIETNKEKLDLYTLLKEIEWFEPLIIKDLIDSEDPQLMRKAMVLSTLNKPYYDQDDILPLRKLGNAFSKFDDVFPVIVTKNSTFGKDKTKWICFSCKTNNTNDSSYCMNCQSNIYGLHSQDFNPVKRSEEILLMADVLEEKFNA